MAVTVGVMAACSAAPGGGLPAGAGSDDGNPAAAPTFVLPSNVKRACPESADPSVAHCLGLVRIDAGGGPSNSGYVPGDIQAAYNLPSSTQGAGQTVAIVDAYDDPKAAKDLAQYRASFGLPACNAANSCFRKVNQD
ncbi:MAG TPA: hypothetical protein VIJ77_06810, partial [Candidatus Tumulicola sp.]